MMASSLLESNPSVGIDLVTIQELSLEQEMSDFKKVLWQTREFSDLTLHVRGQSIKAHKMVMAAHSAYFQNLANFDTATKVPIDAEPNLVELILTFLYCNHIQIAEDRLDMLRRVADDLGIQSLVNKCRYVVVLKSKLTTENCADIWEAAHNTGDQVLCAKAMKMTLENFQNVQHKPGFQQLPLECIIQCLTHPDVIVSAPDEKLSACFTWVLGDQEVRVAHLPKILDLLPLQDMQDWFLRRMLKDPLCINNVETKKMLQAAIDQKGRKLKVPHQDATKKPPKQQEETQTTYTKGSEARKLKSLVMIGFTKLENDTQEGVLADPSSDMFLIQQYSNNISNIGLQNPKGNAICTHENFIFLSGIGANSDEVWQLTVANNKMESCQRLGIMTTPRVDHCMLYDDQKLYMFGGFNEDEDVSIASVEMFDLQEKAQGSKLCGKLPYANQLNKTGDICKLVCTTDQESKNVLLFGNFTDSYRHVLQLYSLVENKVNHTMILPLENTASAIDVLPVGAGKFLLLARNYTATCTFSDIVRNTPNSCEYKGKYTVPNWRCAAVLSDDGENVLLYGGIPRPHQPKHYVYTASVRDIVGNKGTGWIKVTTNWPFGAVCMTGYDSVKL